MVFYGEDFPEFLIDFEHTQKLPYLSDVARLELIRHWAYHAADSCHMTSEDFKQIIPSQFEQSKVYLHPSLQLVRSGYPIFSIWQSHQPNSDTNAIVDMEAASEQVIVARHNFEVCLFSVDAVTYDFYHGLSKRLTVSQAADIANAESEQDITNAIVLGIGNGFFQELMI